MLDVQNMLKVIHVKKIILKLDVIFNINGCSWWFATVVEHFITSRGGTNKFVVKFFILSDYLQLRIDVNKKKFKDSKAMFNQSF
jgi:hypothetical protein